MVTKFLLSWVLGGMTAFMPLAAIEAPAAAQPQSIVVLGGGIGALTSALYLARAGLQPIVIEGHTPGGLLTQSHSVQNWPGELEIEGQALMQKVRAHAEASGARFLQQEVVEVDFSKRPFVLKTKSLQGGNKTQNVVAESCIIAMGTTPNFLGVPGEQDYWGHGVTNCAICDGSLYRNRIVGVVGGGDAAVLEALYLAKIAKEVHVFVRKDQLRANEAKRIEALFDQPNIKVYYNTQVAEIRGDGAQVKSVVLADGSEKFKEMPLDGLFLAIGSRPNSELFQKALELDERGYIVLKKDQETSVPGVYAVGDIVDPVYKQAISASGDGAKAALQAQTFLMDRLDHLVRLKQGNGNTDSKIASKTQSENSAEDKNVAIGHKPEQVASVPNESKMIEIYSAKQFQQELDNADSLVIADFYAVWCGPCKQVASFIEASAEQLSGKVKFLKVNVDQVPELTMLYKIQGMPTILLLNQQGKVVERKMGMDQILELLNRLESK